MYKQILPCMRLCRVHHLRKRNWTCLVERMDQDGFFGDAAHSHLNRELGHQLFLEYTENFLRKK